MTFSKENASRCASARPTYGRRAKTCVLISLKNPRIVQGQRNIGMFSNRMARTPGKSGEWNMRLVSGRRSHWSCVFHRGRKPPDSASIIPLAKLVLYATGAQRKRTRASEQKKKKKKEEEPQRKISAKKNRRIRVEINRGLINSEFIIRLARVCRN